MEIKINFVRLIFAAMAISVCATLDHPVRGQPPGGLTPDSRATGIVAAMVAEREKLFMGDVALRGRISYDLFVNEVQERTSQVVDEQILFDYPHNWVRQQVDTSMASADEPQKQGSPPIHVINVSGPDGAYTVQVEAKLINSEATRKIPALDLRTFGLISFIDIQSHPSLTECISRLDNQWMTVHADPNSGLSILEIQFRENPTKLDLNQHPIMKRTIWVDELSGYTPVRLEDQMWDKKSSTWLPARSFSAVTWNKIDEVWVPVSVVIETDKGSKAFQFRHNSYVVALEWSSVNKEIKESEFTLAGLDTPKGSHLITDSRIDPRKLVIIQDPAIPDAEQLKRIVAANERSLDKPFVAPERGVSFATWLVVVNVVIIVIVVVAWWAYRLLGR